jgi:hypothetical protein
MILGLRTCDLNLNVTEPHICAVSFVICTSTFFFTQLFSPGLLVWSAIRVLDMH